MAPRTRIDDILELAGQGHTPEAISASTGYDVRYVRRMFSLRGLYYASPASPPPSRDPLPRAGSWECIPGAVDALMELCRANLSASLITERLNTRFGANFSRNAVLGKLYRLGLPLGSSRGVSESLRIKAGLRRTKTAPALQFKSRGKRKARTTAAPVVGVGFFNTPPPVIGRKTMAQINLDVDCRWPVGDPKTPAFRYCGNPSIPGQSYCETCRRRAYEPVVRKAKAPDPLPTQREMEPA